MQIAQISDGVLKAVRHIQLKPVYDCGRWWYLRDTMVLYEWMQQFGWQEVVDVPRPSDTTSDWTKTVEIVEGVPTEVWVVRPWTVEELAAKAEEATRISLDQRVRDAVAKGGTLDTALGSADTAWVPGTALTLRNYKAMTTAQMKALNLAQTQELLAKLAPLLVDIAVATKRSGKLSVSLYDES